MLYLYVLTTEDVLADEAQLEIQAAYPQSFGRKAKVLGTLHVEDGLPETRDDYVNETCLRVCRENGLRFNPRRDEIAYKLQSVGDAQYGVCEIYIARYALLSVYAAAAVAFLVGLALGVTAPSVWILSIGLFGLLFYLSLRGAVRRKNEGWFFAVGPVLMMSWVAGFIVRALVF